MKIIGIDLGTSNTYVYLNDAPDEGENLYPDVPKPLLLPFLGDDGGSMATAVLYEDDKPILIGNVAQSEFYVNLEARPKRRLATQFKPEIAGRTPEAMTAMTDFLRLLREALPPELLAGDVRVYAGMPSLSREDYALNLGDCFLAAGWPKPLFARESDAALISCLQSGVLSAADVDNGSLILDFGGGTFDYTRVENLDALQSGGDVLYGGRLFDDLIYQAFCRHNEDFARDAPDSPYAWYVHWVECKRQKEIFSDFLRESPPDAATTLRIVWYDENENRRDAFLRDYTREAFTRDAEDYSPTPEILEILEPYRKRGGLSSWARDLLAGRSAGLLAWARTILENAESRASINAVILTGGSSRWFFMEEIARSVFPGAKILQSRRGFEDIAFGLALFPLLEASSRRAKTLLGGDLDAFAVKASALAKNLVEKEIRAVTAQCAERIAALDVLPALETAQKNGASAEELERAFSANIAADAGLKRIVEEKSAALREKIGEELNFAFRRWLKENGVFMAPPFEFSSRRLGEDFFETVSVKISRLDTLNLMNFTLKKIIPTLTGIAAAGVIAHAGEPVSAIVGGGLAGGGAWVLARLAPGFLARRKLPSFFLNETNRRKIVAKNREYIEKTLTAALEDTWKHLGAEIETVLRDSLTRMVGKLTVLNQVRIN